MYMKNKLVSCSTSICYTCMLFPYTKLFCDHLENARMSLFYELPVFSQPQTIIFSSESNENNFYSGHYTERLKVIL